MTEFAKEFTVVFEIDPEYLGDTENVLTVGYGIEDFMAKMFAQDRIAKLDDRKKFIYLLARFVKSYNFLTCFFTYPEHIGVFAAFAEYVGPQLIKQGSISELMKQVRQTSVVKASVQYKGEVAISGKIKLKKGRKGGGGPPPKKVSVQDMIERISKKFQIKLQQSFPPARTTLLR